MVQNSKQILALYVRSIIFGVEDSLVSTVGLLSGVASANAPRQTILIAGLVLIFVEAFSMGAGSFLSEHSAEEYTDGKEVKKRPYILGGLVMFFSYFISGFVPLFPYLIFGINYAFGLSIIFSLAALFILGVTSAKFFKINIIKHSLEMLLIGGAAVGIGVMVGRLVSL